MELKYVGENLAYTREGDAGLDLRADTNYFIPYGGTMLISTQIKAIELPVGTVGLVCSRSGLASKGITVANQPGIIDENYRGPVKVLLTNNSNGQYVVVEGDRIAQLVIVPVVQPTIVQVDQVSKTVRGDQGFGSSGVS